MQQKKMTLKMTSLPRLATVLHDPATRTCPHTFTHTHTHIRTHDDLLVPFAVAPCVRVCGFSPSSFLFLFFFKVEAAQKRIPAYGQRHGWRPRQLEDFADGGAFPEIHMAQYPLGMGMKKGQKEKSTAVVPLQVGKDGKVKYDALVKQGHHKDRVSLPPPLSLFFFFCFLLLTSLFHVSFHCLFLHSFLRNGLSLALNHSLTHSLTHV